MTTKARFFALQWFADHEEFGPDGVFKRKSPSARMRRLMAKEGQVSREPIGQFKYEDWKLTPEGREILENKPQVRRRGLPRSKEATV